MNRGRSNELQSVMTQRKRVALLYCHHAPFQIQIFIELTEHLGCHGRAHHLGLGIGSKQTRYATGVVGFHVMSHKIVNLTAIQRLLHLLGPLILTTWVAGIHDGHLVVENHIGIVAHAFGRDILAFKQTEIGIVAPDIFNVVTYF